MTVVLIDERRLERECFERTISLSDPHTTVIALSKVDDWLELIEKSEPPDAVLYSTLGRHVSEKKVADEIALLEKACRPVPVIVLSTFEDSSEMVAALDCGARGYIPASLGIDATLTAVRLSIQGAVFMTADSIKTMNFSAGSKTSPDSAVNQVSPGASVDCFTTRQAAVADRLRRGKPNKIIAYELNMCESTVKVHIRNIMKKLRVSNRTEAGYKLNSMISDVERSAALGDNVQRKTDSDDEQNGNGRAPLAKAAKSHSSSATVPAAG